MIDKLADYIGVFGLHRLQFSSRAPRRNLCPCQTSQPMESGEAASYEKTERRLNIARTWQRKGIVTPRSLPQILAFQKSAVSVSTAR